ncbi:MAG: U32 family peptidase [Clostridia bacterium]
MELLSPAGNEKALQLAVYNGADAVYLGLDNFNARIKADNFTKENLYDYVRFCHLYGVKVYLTLNINIKDNELKEVEEIIICANKAKVDAFIITDFALVPLIKKNAPTIAMHASTQIGTHNVYGAMQLKKLGFTRVVLSREATINEITQIKQETGLEIEYFVHGALCVAFSGGCLLSSIISGNSGNRGRCLQPCRMAYTSSLTNKTAYYLSPKEQCLITKLKQLKEAGVDSLKIEGRLKRPEYVAEVTKEYRKTLNNEFKVGLDAIDNMKKLFNREFTTGYSFEKAKIINFRSQNHLGLAVATITKSYKKGNKFYLDINSKHKFIKGDGIKVFTFNKEAGGFEVNEVTQLNSFTFTINADNFYKENSEIFLTTDSKKNEELLNYKRTLQINMEFIAKLDCLPTLKICYNNILVTVEGQEKTQIATKSFATTESVTAQLSKINNTIFSLQNIKIDIDNNLFLPVSVLNNMRREAIEKLEIELLKAYDSACKTDKNSATKQGFNALKTNENNATKACDTASETLKNESVACAEYCAESKNASCLTTATPCGNNKSKFIVELSDMVTPSKFLCENADIVINISDFHNNNLASVMKSVINYNSNCNTYLKLPKIALQNDLNIIKKLLAETVGLTGVYCDNLYGLELACKYNLKTLGGIGLNLFNTISPKILNLDNYIASVELNAKELKSFDKNCYIYAYGYLPLMTFAHCPLQANFGYDCNNCVYHGAFYYQDKKETYNIARTKINNCYFTLYNGKNLSLVNKVSQLNFNFYLDMLQYSVAEAETILKAFIENKSIAEEDVTYGHFQRGVL